MKPEKALEYFNNRLRLGQCGRSTTQRKAFEAAIEALEKQIPKEPIHKDGDIICPNCLGALIYCGHSFKGNYCDECGQAIDWSNE